MRLQVFISLCAISVLGGCASPQIRFTRTECIPVVGEEQTEAVRFISNFQTNEAVTEQQLIYQVAIVDSSGRQVPSGTGKYADKSGNLSAAKGLMVLQSPWSFENIDVSIPAPELSAARESGAAYALFQLTTPDGQIVAQDRAPLPQEFASNRRPDSAIAMRNQRAEEARESSESDRPLPPRGRSAPPPPAAESEPPPRIADSRASRSNASDSAKAQNPSPSRRTSTRARPESIVRESAPPEDDAATPPQARRAEPQPRRRSDDEAVAADKPERKAEEPAPRESRSSTNPRRAVAQPPRESEPAPQPAPRSKEITSSGTNTARRNTSTAANSRNEKAPPAQPAARPTKPVEPEPGVQDVVATPPPDRSSGTNYEVKASDSLRSIALEQYGDAQYWPMILRANPEVNPLKLKVGDKLYLPPLEEIQSGNSSSAPRKSVDRPAQAPAPTASVYVTKDGDTLPFIAKQLYGDSRRWREIYDLNRDQLETPSAVRRGMRLKLPEAPAKSADNEGKRK